MPGTQPIECDVVIEGREGVALTVSLLVVPRIGEEIDLDLGDTPGTADGLYQVIGVRHHLRPRKLTRSGDLFGVRLTLRPLP